MPRLRTSQRGQARHHLLVSGYHTSDKAKLSMQIETLGGQLLQSDRFLPDCTHVVCVKPTRGEKYLGGCITGKWILTSAYIEDSYRCGRWLQEEGYEWNPDKKHLVPDPSQHFLLKAPCKWRQRLAAKGMPPFVGWSAAVMVANAQKKMVYKRLLELGGATIQELDVPIRSPKKLASSLTHVFLEDKFILLLKPLQDRGVLCVPPVYIGDYLLQDSAVRRQSGSTTPVRKKECFEDFEGSILLSPFVKTPTNSRPGTPQAATIKGSGVKMSPATRESVRARRSQTATQSPLVAETASTRCTRSTSKSTVSEPQVSSRRKTRSAVLMTSHSASNSPSTDSRSESRLSQAVENSGAPCGMRIRSRSRPNTPTLHGATVTEDIRTPKIRLQRLSQERINRYTSPSSSPASKSPSKSPSALCNGMQSDCVVTGHVVASPAKTLQVRVKCLSQEHIERYTSPNSSPVSKSSLTPAKRNPSRSSLTSGPTSAQSPQTPTKVSVTRLSQECILKYASPSSSQSPTSTFPSSATKRQSSPSRAKSSLIFALPSSLKKASQSPKAAGSSQVSSTSSSKSPRRRNSSIAGSRPNKPRAKRLGKEDRLQRSLTDFFTRATPSSTSTSTPGKTPPPKAAAADKAAVGLASQTARIPETVVILDDEDEEDESSQSFNGASNLSSHDTADSTTESSTKQKPPSGRTRGSVVNMDSDQKKGKHDEISDSAADGNLPGEPSDMNNSKETEAPQVSSSTEVRSEKLSNLGENAKCRLPHMRQCPAMSAIESGALSLDFDNETVSPYFRRKETKIDCSVIHKDSPAKRTLNLEDSPCRSSSAQLAPAGAAGQGPSTSGVSKARATASVTHLRSNRMSKRRAPPGEQELAVVKRRRLNEPYDLDWVPSVYMTPVNQPLPIPGQVAGTQKFALSYNASAIVESCLEEGMQTEAVNTVLSLMSTTRYPQPKTLNMLFVLLLENSSEDLVLLQKAYGTLCRVLQQHPPNTLALQHTYLQALRKKGRLEGESGEEWELLRQVMSQVCSESANVCQTGAFYLLKFLALLFERDFQIYRTRLLQNNPAKKAAVHPCLWSQVMWPVGQHGKLNMNVQYLVETFLGAISTEQVSLVTTYQSLVTLTAECCRLDIHSANPGQVQDVGLDDIPNRALTLVKDLAYRIGGELEDLNHLKIALSTIQLPWLVVHVCRTLLDMYEDILLPMSVQENMEISLYTIVSRYLYLIPPLADCSPKTSHAHCTPVKNSQALQLLADANQSSNFERPGTEPTRRNKSRKTRKVQDPKTKDPCSVPASPAASSCGGSVGLPSPGMSPSLKRKLASVNKRNCRGEISLHTACIQNDVSRVRDLLQIQGIKVNTKDNFGWTPLHEAANRGHIQCLQLLLDYRPKKTITSYFKADKESASSSRVDLLAANNEGVTALHDAAYSNQLEAVQILLQYGGAKLLEAQTLEGQKPLDFAETLEMRNLLETPVVQMPATPNKRRHQLNSVDGFLSQSSQGSANGDATGGFVPSEEAYVEALGKPPSANYVSADSSLRYVVLVQHLLTAYMKAAKLDLFGLAPSPTEDRSKSIESTKEGDSSSNTQTQDAEVLRSLKSHVRGFQSHLARISLEQTLGNQVKQSLSLLKLLVGCVHEQN